MTTRTNTTTLNQNISYLNALVTRLAGQPVVGIAQNRAFERLFSACLGIVYKQYKYAPKTLRDYTEDDFVQEARIQFYRTLGRFDLATYGAHPDRFRIFAGYFKRRLLEVVKKLKQYAHRSLDAFQFDEAKHWAASKQDDGELLEAAEAVLIHEADRTLRPYLPAILHVLRTGDRLVDAAARFQVNRESLRRNLNRALDLLRTELFEAA